jgi:hypothetical protein
MSSVDRGVTICGGKLLGLILADMKGLTTPFPVHKVTAQYSLLLVNVTNFILTNPKHNTSLTIAFIQHHHIGNHTLSQSLELNETCTLSLNSISKLPNLESRSYAPFY